MGYLEIAVEDVKLVELVEGKGDLYESAPYLFLCEGRLLLLVGNYLLVEIAIIRKLHDNAGSAIRYHRELDSTKACL